MNKKGFISVTVIYSFFLVFLTLMMFIIVNLVTNRNMINSIKKSIKEDISETNFSSYLVNRYKDLGLVVKGDSYRYIGANPNNYIKFNNELYRIIGIIDGKVKIIKYDSIPSITFNNAENNNKYETSSVNEYLNGEYLNTIDASNLIDNTVWYVGGISYEFLNKSGTEVIKAEVGSDKNNGVTVIKKIALPYISDYIYASASNSISSKNNWMFTSNMWFISRTSEYKDSNNETYNFLKSYYLDSNGTLKIDDVTSKKNIKPVFFLSGNVRYVGGTGTSSNPYVVG